MQYASLEPLPLEPDRAGPPASSTSPDPRLAQTGALLPPHLELRRIIGEGGSSVVFEAFHARLKVLVAVKVLSVRGELAQEAYKRMTREAELYALLDDPRIPRVYDVNELSNGTPYVVMEMVPGRSLEDLLGEVKVIAVPLALTISHEVLSVLAAVHERGVLHRDVKPANVILNFPPDGSCQVRLVDFGIAKASTYGTGEEAVTQRGTLVGTPQYMPPERLTGDEANEMSDTYAVGIMLYEMLSGQVPFGGPNLGAVMASVLRDVVKPLVERCPGVSRDLEALVLRAISRDLGERFATANDMLAALDALTVTPEAGSAAQLLGHALPRPELSLNDGDTDDELYAAQRGKRGYGAVLLTFSALLLVGTVGWFYVEYKENTEQRDGSQTGVHQLLRGPDSAPVSLPVAPAPAPATQAAAQPDVSAAQLQLRPPPQPEIEATIARPESETRRRRNHHRTRRDAHAAPMVRTVETPAEPPAQAVTTPPAAPDYAKLLPDNPF